MVESLLNSMRESFRRLVQKNTLTLKRSKRDKTRKDNRSYGYAINPKTKL